MVHFAAVVWQNDGPGRMLASPFGLVSHHSLMLKSGFILSVGRSAGRLRVSERAAALGSAITTSARRSGCWSRVKVSGSGDIPVAILGRGELTAKAQRSPRGAEEKSEEAEFGSWPRMSFA